MIESLIEILNFISHDLIIGFGIYAVLNFSIRLITRKKRLNAAFDNAAIDVAFILGLLTGLTWLILTFTNTDFRLTFLIQPLIWIGLSLILRLNKFKSNLIVRLLFSLSFVLTFERLVILITYFHSDYLPNTWSTNDLLDESLRTTLIVLGLALKLILFTTLSALYFLFKKKLNNN